MQLIQLGSSRTTALVGGCERRIVDGEEPVGSVNAGTSRLHEREEDQNSKSRISIGHHVA